MQHIPVRRGIAVLALAARDTTRSTAVARARQRNRSRAATRAAALLLMAALAACSDAPTSAVITAADQPAAFNTAPTVTVTNSGGTPLISWGALAGATSYSVDQKSQFVAVMNGRVYKSVGSRSVGSTSGTSLLDTVNIYTGKSSCTWNYPNGDADREDHWYVVTATFASGTSTTTVDAPIADC